MQLDQKKCTFLFGLKIFYSLNNKFKIYIFEMKVKQSIALKVNIRRFSLGFVLKQALVRSIYNNK